MKKTESAFGGAPFSDPSLPPGWRIGKSAVLVNRFIAMGPGKYWVVWSLFFDPMPDEIPPETLASMGRRAWAVYHRAQTLGFGTYLLDERVR